MHSGLRVVVTTAAPFSSAGAVYVNGATADAAEP